MKLGEKISRSPKYVIDINRKGPARFGGVGGGGNSEKLEKMRYL